ncbi:MAG: AarF/ABC1/UbiB kinase family protein [Chloroflexi bacterium]|nr:MAG: AarF/ABC1/UbiB kinase family protein [Chloroflexota bacterium]MBL1193209.1 AarF/ABC1/UbiB kinase family protein [Chloroflexota bacterium]NOH10503.1 AarF/ABC1/UbiB kinase family protein [Chloroflexota bacterium]
MLRSRYRRITFFFARVILGLIWWEFFLPRIGLRGRTRNTRTERLRKAAVAFRAMAIDMGGVMIKVGQFLSARVDVLPEVITAELSELQDEVRPETYEDIRTLAEAELGASLETLYAEFDSQPLAAASLGQVHRAKLKKPQSRKQAANGSVEQGYVDVVVKVQRPNIKTIIDTDLAALSTVGRWVQRYRPISKRANIPALLEEFSRVTYQEIDYLAEGRNAETFATNFAERPEVSIPEVVWSHTTQCVLTLEDVYAIKITDYEAMEAAGIDRRAVASRLVDVYLQQIFEDAFFHADPHPGNLFVTPVPDGDEENDGWLLTFVDFGMVGTVPDNSIAGLRELLIGMATKDPGRMIKAYQLLEVLLPSADLELVERLEAMAFDRFWGKSMEELREVDYDELREFAHEFRDIVYQLPFQVPQDLIFLGRTVAILSGIATGLHAQFNFWDSIAPYAQKLIQDEEGGFNLRFWLSETVSILQVLWGLPRQLDAVLGKMERGNLVVQVPQATAQLRSIEWGVRRIVGALTFIAFLSNGVQLYLAGELIFSGGLLAAAALNLAWLILPRRRRR